MNKADKKRAKHKQTNTNEQTKEQVSECVLWL